MTRSSVRSNKKRWIMSGADTANNFRRSLERGSKAKFTPKLQTPLLGELYWIDSRMTPSRVQPSFSLRKHNGAGHDPFALVISSPARNSLCRLRLPCKLREFESLADGRELRLLKPHICTDDTKFGVEMVCDMEGAAIAGRICAALLDNGKLGNL